MCKEKQKKSLLTQNDFPTQLVHANRKKLRRLESLIFEYIPQLISSPGHETVVTFLLSIKEEVTQQHQWNILLHRIMATIDAPTPTVPSYLYPTPMVPAYQLPFPTHMVSAYQLPFPPHMVPAYQLPFPPHMVPAYQPPVPNHGLPAVVSPNLHLVNASPAHQMLSQGHVSPHYSLSMAAPEAKSPDVQTL